MCYNSCKLKRSIVYYDIDMLDHLYFQVQVLSVGFPTIHALLEPVPSVKLYWKTVYVHHVL